MILVLHGRQRCNFLMFTVITIGDVYVSNKRRQCTRRGGLQFWRHLSKIAWILHRFSSRSRHQSKDFVIHYSVTLAVQAKRCGFDERLWFLKYLILVNLQYKIHYFGTVQPYRHGSVHFNTRINSCKLNFRDLFLKKSN